jgi:TRAP-type uncharacterized transport system substrate-binding protein
LDEIKLPTQNVCHDSRNERLWNGRLCSPPVPDDDVTTLRTNLYLVANKKLSADLVGSLTKTIMSVRRDLIIEEPIFAQIAAPSADADAYLPLHPGAAAFYNGTAPAA